MNLRDRFAVDLVILERTSMLVRPAGGDALVAGRRHFFSTMTASIIILPLQS
jgi:hypothetical protein